MARELFKTRIRLTENEIVEGPVFSEDLIEFVFVNRHSSLDFYVQVSKRDNSWYQSGGPDVQFKIEIIEQLGEKIDLYLSQKK